MNRAESIRAGIDTGGTFTDLVAAGPDGLRVVKALSTPRDPARAVLAALDEASVPKGRGVTVVHGTTVATNTLLTRKGRGAVCLTSATAGRRASGAFFSRDSFFQYRPGVTSW